MTINKFRNHGAIILCTLLLTMPVVSQAASDEELATMRAQLQALSARLDRLEAENRELTAANEALMKSNRQTEASVAAVSEKTDAVAQQINDAGSKSSWADKLSWKGDFRYRYESFDIEGRDNRNRNRVRARATLMAQVTPTVKVGVGLASGGSDPVSSNQTLGNGGSTKDLRLDLAYFDWNGLKDTHIIGGKFSNFMHRSGRNALLWDGDWRPEGFGIKWSNDRFFANGLGTWIESDTRRGKSFAYLTQFGVTLPVGENVKLVTGIGYHNYNTQGRGSFYGDDDDFYGNSFDPVTNRYLYDYEELEFFADLGFDLFNQPARVFANYVQNQDADDDDKAYALGFQLGSAKNRGEWQFGYVYQRIEADSVFGLLTDSDFGGGGTDSKGSIIKGSYALAKNLNANLTYFINDAGLNADDPIDYKRLQLDLSFKY